MRGDTGSVGGTIGAANASCGSSGRVARSVVDGGGTFGAAAVITRRCVYKIIFRGVRGTTQVVENHSFEVSFL